MAEHTSPQFRTPTLDPDVIEAWNDYDNHMIVAHDERPAVS